MTKKMEVFFVDILGRLCDLQEQYGWSDYKIAKEAGLSPNTVSNVYRRNNTPSLPTLEAICGAFGITMAQFFAEDALVELAPEHQELIKNWNMLSEDQKDVLWQLIRTFQKK